MRSFIFCSQLNFSLLSVLIDASNVCVYVCYCRFGPAGPWFQGKLDRTVEVNPTSARFVDVIDIGIQLGQLKNLGHSDFYPSDAASQPGCSLTVDAKDSGIN